MADARLQDPTRPDWTYMIHQDIKADNIFLGVPDPTSAFPQWPTIKIGDFGMARLTSDTDGRNPTLFATYDQGTIGYQS